MSDYDKQQWQAEQEARDIALEAQRQKWAKAKARAARNAQRKIDRLARKLSESGNLTDWEEEFTESVGERLDKFGSAFHDPEKGRPVDALSFAQKKVVAALKKKAKDEKKQKVDGEKTRRPFKARSSFNKNKGYTPRVRQLEDEDFEVETPAESEAALDREPFIPEISSTDRKPPFLRLVK